MSMFKTPALKDRKGERGAALVTVLMISFLLLVAVIALALETSMNTGNVTDATSEEQAYYAAESGIQSVVDALRHNAVPNPLLDAAATPYPPDPDAAEANRINYVRAARREFSNATCTRSGSTVTCTSPLDAPDSRLSRWLRYNWGPNGGASATNKDRIVLGDPNTYSPINGFAYSVTVRDPDYNGGFVTYTMGGGIADGLGSFVPSRTFVGPGGTTTITYTPPAQQNVDVSTGSGNGSLGSFTITNTGTGGTIPSGDALVRFKILMIVSNPEPTYVVMRGYILPPGGSLRSTATSTCARPDVSFMFDSEVFLGFASKTTITNGGCTVEEEPITHNGPFGTYLTGRLIQSAGSGVPLPLTASISEPEPTRLLIQSTGYGPRGARKQLETIIQKNYFDGLGAPSPLTMIGPPCTQAIPFGNCVASPTVSDFMFDPGNSTPVFYSGKDKKLRAFLPPIGVTNEPNKDEVINGIRTGSGFKGTVYGMVENVADELPFWLQNPANLDEALQLLRDTARASGTYYSTNPPSTGYGDYDTATGINFVEGDVTISGDGGGILIVTGQLEFRGQFRFNGLVLITGQNGFLRSGGGSGNLAGNMIVAPYNSWSINTCMPNALVTNKLNCYLPPRYRISGGGNSDLMYNSQNVRNGLDGIGNFVKGVAEK